MRPARGTSRGDDSGAARAQLGFGARREPQSDRFGGLTADPGLRHLGDGLIEVPLQMIEVREPARDVSFNPAPPPLPEPELEPSEVERVGGELAQGDPDRAAA
jgi:hypothetical protein